MVKEVDERRWLMSAAPRTHIGTKADVGQD